MKHSVYTTFLLWRISIGFSGLCIINTFFRVITLIFNKNTTVSSQPTLHWVLQVRAVKKQKFFREHTLPMHCLRIAQTLKLLRENIGTGRRHLTQW